MMNDNSIQNIINTAGGNFTSDEFLSGRSKLVRSFIREVALWRNWHGFKFQITSAYRDEGSHSYGKAVDGLLWKQWRVEQPDPMHIWRLATTWPWMGVGIYFDWEDGCGIHLDMNGRSQSQRPLRWMRIKGEYYYQDLLTGYFYRKNSLEGEDLELIAQEWYFGSL